MEPTVDGGFGDTKLLCHLGDAAGDPVKLDGPLPELLRLFAVFARQRIGKYENSLV